MKDLDVFMDVIAQEDFVEGHECLEERWREWKNDPEKREESFILKGLINGATALALERLGRSGPAQQVWGTFEKYRPLIRTIESPYSKRYEAAETLLDQKHKEIMTHSPSRIH